MHPLLHLIVSEPELLAEHAEAYAELAAAEIDSASATLKRRALMGALALASGGVGIVLAGIAIMLWAVTPEVEIRAPWVLWATPLVPLLAAVLCGLSARNKDALPAFHNFREQLKADIAMLREVTSP